MTEWLFDGLLAAGLLWLGWRTVSSPDPLKAVILFIVFGLLMALCWARLAAPDVALAEAAIGAGLTGALLLDTCRVLLADPRRSEHATLARRSQPAFPLMSAVLALLGAGLVGGLGWVLLTLPAPALEPGAVVHARLDESGVTNPVTAVLLNFRSYDTLLEVGVLLLAVLGVWVVGRGEASPLQSPATENNSPLAEALIHVLLPMTLLTGGYLLWAGTHAPGGAFQAGAVLAAVGVLLSLSERLPPPPAPYLVRALLVLGLIVFTTSGLGMLIWSGHLLEYPPALAGPLILAIEATLTLSIAVSLLLLFRGAGSLTEDRP